MLTLYTSRAILAATINYDNLFVLDFAATLLLTFTIFDDFAAPRIGRPPVALGQLTATGLPSKISVFASGLGAGTKVCC